MNPTEWSELLGPALAEALVERGFSSLTSVQTAVLAAGVVDRDLRISSQTGSGKTVAIGFVVRGELEAERDEDERAAKFARPRVLVIVPTRELATQVKDELSWLYAKTWVRATAVFGGSGYREELRELARRPAVVVATPGRLKDHLDRRAIDAKGVRAVVLDEADRMLDMGFREELEAILAHVPKERRTHLVSATFSSEVRALADRVQKEPLRVEGTPLGEANRDIEHLVHLVREEDRVGAIINLALATPDAPTLVFVRMRADVSSLAEQLSTAGFRVGTLSGEMDQRERERTLAAFKRGSLHVLVATDVAARGIDVQGVGRVVHAEPPESSEAYTHRSGRTGRAGEKGTSSILVGPRGLSRTTHLLSRARVAYRFAPIPSAKEIRAQRAERLFESLTEDREGEEHDRDDETLAVRLEKSGQITRALVRLLQIARRSFAAAEPQEITKLTPPPERQPRPHVPAPRASSPRASSPRLEHREPRPEQREKPRAPKPHVGGWTTFRVTWGQAHGATTRRLVAMLCRRGEIGSQSIGTIKVLRTHSLVEVASDVADDFASRAAVPDPRDPRVKIRPE